MTERLGFWSFVLERQQIFRKRQCGYSAPWTDDPILQKYHFTNVFRDLDRGTQVLARALDRHSGTDPALKVLNVMVYRTINNVETWQSVGGWVNSWAHAQQIAVDVDARGNFAFTQAWEVNQKLRHAFLRGVGVEPYRKQWNPAAVHTAASNASTFEDVMRVLRTYPALSKFAGYQVTLDLGMLYPKLHSEAPNGPIRVGYTLHHGEAEERWRGPGAAAARVLSKVHPGDVFKKYGQRGGMTYLNQLVEQVRDQQDQYLFGVYGVAWHDATAGQGRRLTKVDVEHALCEFDKYERLLDGRGRHRKFTPHVEVK